MSHRNNDNHIANLVVGGIIIVVALLVLWFMFPMRTMHVGAGQLAVAVEKPYFFGNKEFALHEVNQPDGSPSLYVHSSSVPLGTEQVVKPAVGRKSSGIEIQQNGQSVKSTDQTYAGGPVVYQPYRPTIKIDGARVMGCMWMYGRQSACLAFREFDSDILELDNERVIMHELVGS